MFLQEFQGNTPISFLIIGENEKKKIELTLNCPHSKIAISKELFDWLSASHMPYRINDEDRWLNTLQEEKPTLALDTEIIIEENSEIE